MRVLLGGAIAIEGRTLHTGREIRAALELELSRGHEKIPMCPEGECPSFDPKAGCPGHPLPETSTEVN